MKLDLHVHSKYSDGDYSPKELLELYNGKLDGLALTDHDNLDGIDEILELSKSYDLKVIAGIELSCNYKGSDIHILGLFIDHKNKELMEVVESLKEDRVKRVEAFLDNFEKDHIYLNRNKILNHNSVSRVHLAKDLCEKGFAYNINDAFQKYLTRRSKYFVPKYNLDIKDGVKLIQNAKGKAILAHPGEIDRLEESLLYTKKAGIDGIEVYHPSNKAKMVEFLEEYSLENNYIITGGSDFHRNKKDIGRYYIDLDID